MKIASIYWLLVFCCGHTDSLIGYDCTNEPEEMLRYSAVDVDVCPEDIHGWYEEPERVELQVIRSPEEAKMKLSKCQVLVDTYAHYCGNVDSIQYGGPIVLGEDEPYMMHHEDCYNLIRYGVMTYKEETFQTNGNNYFTKDLTVKGSSDPEAGTCTHSAAFTSHDQDFTHSILRNVIKVSLIEDAEVTYNFLDQEVVLDNKPVPVTNEHVSTTEATYYWSNPIRDCDAGENMREGFYGVGNLYRPTNPSLPQMLLINIDSSKQTFGLELRSQRNECGFTLYNTQLDEVMVSINLTNDGNNWRVPGLTKETLEDVDPVENLESLVTYNFVVLTNDVSYALADLTHRSCTNKREATLTDLALMRINEEQGIFKVFGRGVNGFIRGADLYLYSCEERNYEYRKTTKNYQDTPVLYTKDGQTHEGFLDAVSWKFKKTSIELPTYDFLPVFYDLQGEYRCKINDDLIPCGQPLVMGLEFADVQSALDQEDRRIGYDGGFQDREHRDQYRSIVDAQSDLEANTYRWGKAVYKPRKVEKDNPLDIFNIPDIWNTIWNAAFNGGILSYVVKGCFILGSLVTAYFMITRCVRLRGSKSEEFKKNYWNYWNAVANPHQFYDDYHMASHDVVRNKLQSIRIVVNREKMKNASCPQIQELDTSTEDASVPRVEDLDDDAGSPMETSTPTSVQHESSSSSPYPLLPHTEPTPCYITYHR